MSGFTAITCGKRFVIRISEKLTFNLSIFFESIVFIEPKYKLYVRSLITFQIRNNAIGLHNLIVEEN